MSIASLFPDSSKLQNADRDEFEREVAARFGLVPNLFRSAPDAPFVVRELWLFAKSAYEELQSLRDLNGRQELEAAKRKLEETGLQKDLLLREVDHRIKNSLQIVSGLLHLQANTAGAAASQFHNAAARVTAIAAVHEQLHKYDYVGTFALDQYLVDLCQGIATASSSSDRAWSLIVDAEPLIISTDIAMPLGLIVNELVINAIQHSQPAGEGGSVHIELKDNTDNFSISITDPGDGPVSAQTGKPGTRHSGLGTRIVETLCRQIEGTITKGRSALGYAVTVMVPHRDAGFQAAGAITRAT